MLSRSLGPLLEDDDDRSCQEHLLMVMTRPAKTFELLPLGEEIGASLSEVVPFADGVVSLCVFFSSPLGPASFLP